MDEKTLTTQDPFQVMERLDEEQVLDEIKGRALDSLVYEIHQGGQLVTGLSLAGIREVVRMMNANGKARIGISDREPIITETEEYFEVKVFAKDTQNGGGYWGIKRQAKFYPNGSPNAFALEQALAKAQRNALRGLIPEYFAKEMIDAFRGRGRVKTIDNTPTESSKRPQGDRRPSVKIMTREYNNMVKRLGDLPYYQDVYHIIGTVGKLGYTEITDDNIAEIEAKLREHASASNSER